MKKQWTYLLSTLFIFFFCGRMAIAQPVIDGNPADWKAILDNGLGIIVPDLPSDDDDNFTEGTKDYSLTSDMTWTIDPVGDKVDLLNGGAAVYVDQENGIIYFFGDRYSSNGSAQIGFWVFQNGTGPNATWGFSPDKTVGDILILAEFSQGGGTATIKLYKWIGGPTSSVGNLQELTLGPEAEAMVSANAAGYDVPTLNPPLVWTYCNKENKDCGKYYPGTFFEGMIDLESLGLSLNLCNASFLLETRQSFEINAKLGDFIYGSLAVEPVVTAVGDELCAPGGTVTLCASSDDDPLDYQWYWDDELMMPVQGGNMACIGVAVTETHTFWVTGTNSIGCVSDAVSATATVYPSPECSITGDAEVCPDHEFYYYGPEGMDSYLWSISGKATIYGDIDDERMVTIETAEECGLFTLTLTITDENGCESTCAKVVSVYDVEKPVAVKCPVVRDLGCNPSQGTWGPGVVEWMDNCDVKSSGVVAGTATSTTGCGMSITHKHWAEDYCGNTAECLEVITWKVDTEAPDIADKDDYKLAGCNPEWPAKLTTTWTDNCGVLGQVTGTLDSDVGVDVITDACIQTRLYTFEAIDDCGNPASQTVTVSRKWDETAPVLPELPEGEDLGCNPAELPECSEGLVATDSCDGAVTVTCEAGEITGTSCLKEQIFTYSAVDECGNDVSATVTYNWKVDLTAPVLPTLPKGGDLGCNPTPPECSEGLVATDNCDGAVTVTCEAGDITGTECLKEQIFTYSAVDECGNDVSATVTYTWKVDLTAPVLPTLPKGGDLGCNPTPPECSEGLVATDNCDGTVTVTCEAGDITGTECLKEQIFTYSAVDECGNDVSATVTYTWKEDTEAPMLEGELTDLEFECKEPVIIPVPVFVDNCDGIVSFTCAVTGVPDADCDTYEYPEGDTEICFFAVDECGNPATECITVTILPCPKDYCTYTQGFYGNQKGKACDLVTDGIPGVDFAKSLLAQADMKIGAGSNYIMFHKEDAAANAMLLTQILKSGGNSSVLTGICDPVSLTCLNQYMRRGTKLRNTLLVQNIVLGLNLRITGDLAGLELEGGKWMVTQEKVDCAEDSGVKEKVCEPVLVGDQIVCMMTTNPYWTKYMLSEELVAALDAFGYDVTVGGLFEMANDALGGVIDPEDEGISLSAIAEAVDLINNVFDECRQFVGYLTEEEVAELLSCEGECVEEQSAKMDGLKSGSLQVYPNPFNDKVTFEFVSAKDAHAVLEIRNVLGQSLSILVDRKVREGVLNRVEFRPFNQAPGILIYRLVLDDTVQTGRIIYKK